MSKQVKSELQLRIEELEQFLKELDEAKAFQKENDTLKISPLAGILERNELESLKKIWENTEH